MVSVLVMGVFVVVVVAMLVGMMSFFFEGCLVVLDGVMWSWVGSCGVGWGHVELGGVRRGWGGSCGVGGGQVELGGVRKSWRGSCRDGWRS